MARAYIVLARNDLDANFLQALDLWPNSSHRNQVLDGPGQTHGLTHYFLDGINSAIATDGAFLVNGDNYGLSAYIIGQFENVNAGEAFTAAEAIAIAVKVEQRVAAGLPLTIADFNAICLIEVGTASGIGLGNSVGTIEPMLRILAGERFFQQDNTVLEAAGTWTAGGTGVFVNRALVETAQSVRTGTAGDDIVPRLPVRGRNPFVGKTIPTTPAVQDEVLAATAQQNAGRISDVNFTDALAVIDTGRLQQSAINGALSRLAAPTYAWRNPAFAYRAADVTAAMLRAVTIENVAIPAPAAANEFQGRAVTVYAADGTVIV
tara:strand:+ start:16434 stop:17393 length:960 start_codon:yes stop_codon:yes gene_type:complete